MADRYHLQDPIIHFERHVSRMADGCWLWTGHKYPRGYGQFHSRRRVVYAHRFAYEYFVGPIPSGLVLDHLCRNRACVNPQHLEPVSHTENVRRGEAVKAVCKAGHTYDANNTYLDVNGWKHCRTCDRERHRLRYNQTTEEIRNVAD